MILWTRRKKLFSPLYYLSPEVGELNGINVIVVYLPESSQVHNTTGNIFDRNEVGDFDITNQLANWRTIS